MSVKAIVALGRVRHGVYRLAGVPISRHDEVRAAWLQAEPGPLRPEQRQAAVCRQSAAAVYGIGDLFAPANQLMLPYPRRTSRTDLRFYVGDLAPDEVDWVEGVRITRPTRIIADLLADGYADLEHLGAIAADAIADGTLSPRALVAAWAPYARRFGVAEGEALVQLMSDGGTFDDLVAA